MQRHLRYPRDTSFSAPGKRLTIWLCLPQTLISHCPSPADSLVVPGLASRFGWAVLQPDILALLTRKCDTASLTDCFKLLLRIASKPPESHAPTPKAGNFNGTSGNDPSVSERETTANAGGMKSEAKRERSLEGRGVTPEPIAELGSGVGASGRARTSTESAAGATDDVSQVPGAEARAEVSGSSTPPREASENVTGTAEPPEPVPPQKPTKEEQAREDLCRSAIAAVVDKLVSKASDTVYSSYSSGFNLNSQNMAPFVRLIERFGGEPFAPAVDVLVRNKVSSSLQSAAELLWDFVRVGHANRPKGSLPGSFPRGPGLLPPVCQGAGGKTHQRSGPTARKPAVSIGVPAPSSQLGVCRPLPEDAPLSPGRSGGYGSGCCSLPRNPQPAPN